MAPLLAGAADWIEEAVEAALLRWSRGERAFRIESERLDRVVEFVRILLAIDCGVDGRDLRTFSVAAGVHSKAFERHRVAVVTVLRGAYGLEGLTADEVIATMGFRPFHQPVHLRGPVSVPSMRMDCSSAHPYVALPPSCVDGIALTGQVAAVLTIENFASFNRHVIGWVGASRPTSWLRGSRRAGAFAGLPS